MSKENETYRAQYYAHSREKNGETQYQTIKEHAEGVAKLVKAFSEKWCVPELAEDLGLLHDVGKYRPGFQRRIRGEKVNSEDAEHSVFGALEREVYSLPDMTAYCIAGHHSGLPDVGSKADISGSGTLYARLEEAKKRVEARDKDYAGYKDELRIKPLPNGVSFFKDAVQGDGEEAWKEYAFWVRMMFSCLADADFLDTEAYCNGDNCKERGIESDFEKCKEAIAKRLAELEKNADTSAKRSRKELREQIMSHADEEADLYYMNMPTGSGKTLASMQFALERAISAGKRRIIYIIPYTSIIEQNAKVFKELFGEEQVLEHHSDFDFGETGKLTYGEDFEKNLSVAEKAKLETTAEKMRRSAENWDASIIITTNVRFFESIYGNRTSALRKLHNMADSILIFDEAHMLPREYFQPCLEAIKILVTRYGCEGIFLTATMPDFDKWLKSFKCEGLKTCDLVEDKSCFSAFERCKIKNLGVVSAEKLLGYADAAKNSLVVVNTRKTARLLYGKYSGRKFHLSTYMTHDDRTRVIGEVRKALKNGEKFCLFSTSLIEAGVDLDFDAVFREQAGLDNLLQTAGRCNRNGERENCVAYSFLLEENEERKKRENELTKKSYFTGEIFARFPKPDSTEAIAEYFNQLYNYDIENMRLKDFLFAKSRDGIVGSCEKSAKRMRLDTVGILKNPVPYNFEGYAESFRLIDEYTMPLVIVTSENRVEVNKILTEIEYGGGRKSLRKLQKYTLSLRWYEREKLLKEGVIGVRAEVEYLSNENYYNRDIGLYFEDDTVYYY